LDKTELFEMFFNSREIHLKSPPKREPASLCQLPQSALWNTCKINVWNFQTYRVQPLLTYRAGQAGYLIVSTLSFP
jgi:hypothetical protein